MLNVWYKDVTIPTFDRQTLLKEFVTSSLGITQAIVSDKINKNLSIKLTKDSVNVPVAAVDQMENIIYINESLFSEHKEERYNPLVDVNETISTLMGLVVHESLHIAHTYPNIPEAFKMADVPLKKFNTTIWNILEDYYIDFAGYKEFVNLNWTTESALNYFFPKKEMMNAIDDLPLSITTLEEVMKYVKVITLLKNFTIKFTPLQIKEFPEPLQILIAMIKKVHSINDKFDRIKLSKQICDYLMKNVETPSDEKQEEESEIKKENSFGDGEEFKEFLEKLQELMDKYSKILDEDVSGEVEETENVECKVKVKSYYSGEHDTNKVTPFEITPDLNTMHLYGFSKRPMRNPVKVDNRFLELSTLIKSRTQANRPYGEQRNYGRSITQIHRIVTDSKIFAEPIEVNSIGPQEIIFLVDMSGSMEYSSKITKSFDAVLGAAMGLQFGRHCVAVYGHSAELTKSVRVSAFTKSLMIYNLKGFDDSIKTLEDRINECKSTNDTMMQNNDDYAIAFCATKFSKIRNNKNLIVVSDGEPASNRISGKDGKVRTKVEVDKLRKQNISVYSLSIEKDDFIANNEIYGNEYNTSNEDPNVVAQMIEKMFTL